MGFVPSGSARSAAPPSGTRCSPSNRPEWSQLLLALGVGPVEVIPLVGSHPSAGVAVNGGLCGYDSINRVLGRIREEHVGVAEGGAAEDENDDGGEGHHQVRSDGLEVLFALVELLGPREYTPEVPTDVLDPAPEPGLQRLGGLCFLGHSSSLSVPCLGMGCEMSVSSFLGEARKAVVGRNLVPRGKLTRPSTAVDALSYRRFGSPMRRETRAKRGRGRSERFDRRKWGWGPKNCEGARLVTANECVARARTLDVTQENARVVGDDEALTRVCAFAGGDTGAARRGAEPNKTNKHTRTNIRDTRTTQQQRKRVF